VEGGHFIAEDVSLFDAPFFNMTSDEAAVRDPFDISPFKK
jgi:acyl transferase domain-containing protein